MLQHRADALRERRDPAKDAGRLRADPCALARRFTLRPHFRHNAPLNTVATYYDLVPGFERLLEAKRGDLKAFHAAVEAMRTMTKAERRAALGGG